MSQKILLESRPDLSWLKSTAILRWGSTNSYRRENVKKSPSKTEELKKNISYVFSRTSKIILTPHYFNMGWQIRLIIWVIKVGCLGFSFVYKTLGCLPTCYRKSRINPIQKKTKLQRGRLMNRHMNVRFNPTFWNNFTPHKSSLPHVSLHSILDVVTLVHCGHPAARHFSAEQNQCDSIDYHHQGKHHDHLSCSVSKSDLNLRFGILICKLKCKLRLKWGGLSFPIWNSFWTPRNWRLKYKLRWNGTFCSVCNSCAKFRHWNTNWDERRDCWTLPWRQNDGFQNGTIVLQTNSDPFQTHLLFNARLPEVKHTLHTDILFLKHESSIFRVIQPCMWFLHDGTG